MKKNYLLFLFLIIFTLCGCSANYELNIDANKSIEEKISINIGKNEYYNYAINNMMITDKNSVESVDCKNITINECKKKIFNLAPLSILSEDTTSYLYQNYFTNDIYDVVKFNSDYNNKYDDISNEYKINYSSNNSLYKTNKMIISKLSNSYTITNENNIMRIKINNIDAPDANKIDTFNIKISSPYEVVSSNASNIIYEKNQINTTWSFDNINTINIDLTLDTSKTIAMKNQEEVKEKRKKTIITIILILVPIALILFIVLTKKINSKDKL